MGVPPPGASLEKIIPCDADLLRSAHDEAKKECLEMFHNKTSPFSIISVDKYLKKLTQNTDSVYSTWLKKNRKESKIFCTERIKELKEKILQPVLDRLHSHEGSKMQFTEIVAAYNEIQQKYSSQAEGPKDIQASVFTKSFNPEFLKEMEHSLHLLQRMKDFDEALTKEKAAKALSEEKRLKVEEEKARIAEEKKNKEREIELLTKRFEEEKVRLKESFERDLQDHKEQLQNMINANFEDHRKERQASLSDQSQLRAMLCELTAFVKPTPSDNVFYDGDGDVDMELEYNEY